MRSMKFTAAFALVLALATGGSASAATRTATIRVEGMTCGSCAVSLEQALKKTGGVADARVSYEKGEAWMKYDDRKVTVARLREVINGAGYRAVTRVRGRRGGAGRPKTTSCCAAVTSCDT